MFDGSIKNSFFRKKYPAVTIEYADFQKFPILKRIFPVTDRESQQRLSQN